MKGGVEFRTCGYVLLFLLGVFHNISNASGCSILPRSAWNATNPKATYRLSTPVKNVVIHHSATQTCPIDRRTCENVINSFQKHHMKTNRWNDIAYNFLIGYDGTIYTGTGWTNQATHSKNFNNVSLGICLIGDFTDSSPPDVQLNAAKALIACGRNNNYIASDYKLYGHRDVRRGTTCPGNELYNEILGWDNKAPELERKH